LGWAGGALSLFGVKRNPASNVKKYKQGGGGQSGEEKSFGEKVSQKDDGDFQKGPVRIGESKGKLVGSKNKRPGT